MGSLRINNPPCHGQLHRLRVDQNHQKKMIVIVIMIVIMIVIDDQAEKIDVIMIIMIEDQVEMIIAIMINIIEAMIDIDMNMIEMIIDVIMIERIIDVVIMIERNTKIEDILEKDLLNIINMNRMIGLIIGPEI